MTPLFYSRFLTLKANAGLLLKGSLPFLLHDLHKTLEKRVALLKKPHQTCLWIDLRRFPLLREEGADVIVDAGHLHGVKDVPAYLERLRQNLAPKGHVLLGFFGGKTLTELRESCLQTDLASYQGAYQRVSPMLRPDSVAQVMGAVGLKEVVVDHESITVYYASVPHLIQDLRSMGETFPDARDPYPPVHRDFWKKVFAYYDQHFREPGQGLRATFDFVYAKGRL